MARIWTDDQKKVLAHDGGNLLVAAAAGSGKTAVMVERIISRVLFSEKNVDIDRIIVVTFTKAAAGEMKERIAKGFMEALKKETDAKRKSEIRRQMSLLDNAQICTIDSFCAFILRNYFNTIDLDPAFRIGDEAELKLLKAEAVDSVIEEWYGKCDDAFFDFVSGYLPVKSDAALSDWIIRLADYSESFPYPKEWIKECLSFYCIDSVDEFGDSAPVRYINSLLYEICSDYISEIDELLSFCRETAGLDPYLENLKEDKEYIQQVVNAKNYEEIRKAFETGGFVEKLSRANSAAKEDREAVQSVRNRIKKGFAAFRDSFYCFSSEDNLKINEGIRRFAGVISNLVTDYIDEYDRLKAEKNILSFSDVEHRALEVLVHTDSDGSRVRTDAAHELSELYEEIYIDEYQDSNMVQELILTAVSRESFGEPNMLMVGDVKQSIYSFRQADPSIFIRKYNSYGRENLIVLDKNFRSRENVLVCINEIFARIMHEKLGGVEYDEKASLKPGREFDGGEENSGPVTELLIYDDSKEDAGEERDDDIIDSDENLSASEKSRKEKLAGIVAKRIKELVKNQKIWDPSGKNGSGDYRATRYSDIVILLRSANVGGVIYENVLRDAGIPAVCTTTTGYFSSREIKEILNILNVIDNPRQDIPLAGALRSYFCFLSAEELAWVKAVNTKTSLYENLLYCLENAEDTIKGKLNKFFDFLTEYREYAGYLPIHELIRKLIYDTGYMSYSSAMESGKLRTANLIKLIDKAREYENTSFHGLFNFLRYIDKIKKYEIESGSANIMSDNDDVVRIMSIHKSKGLEFPIVFVGDMEKKYNLMDTREKIIYNKEFGIAMDYINAEGRICTPSFIKKAVAQQKKLGAISEELRILYVALTRAVEKLILVGYVNSYDKSYEKWKARAASAGGDFTYIYENMNYLDLCAPAFHSENKSGRYEISVFGQSDADSLWDGEKQDEISEKEDEAPLSDEEIARLRRKLEYIYPNMAAVSMPVKLSVSELKHEMIESSENEAVHLVEPALESVYEYDTEQRIRFASGTERGNAYHKVFELWDYNVGGKDAGAFIESLADSGLISREYKELVNPKKFEYFLDTDIGRRMKRAALSGLMYREQQFVAGFKAKELREEYADSDELILLQGIIDCYFYEDDEIVVVDYKTDSVKDGNTDILAERYSKQLELYRDAVMKMTGKNVRECIIYSVNMNKEIPIWHK